MSIPVQRGFRNTATVLEAEARKLEAERERLKQATASLTMEAAEPEQPTGPPPFSSHGYYRQEPTSATTQKSALSKRRKDASTIRFRLKRSAHLSGGPHAPCDCV